MISNILIIQLNLKLPIIGESERLRIFGTTRWFAETFLGPCQNLGWDLLKL